MGNRIKDLQAAQIELHDLGRSGWFPHDLQRGRMLVGEVLRWMGEEDLPASRTCQADMIAAQHSDSPRVIMRAVAAAEQAIALGIDLPGGNTIFTTSFCNFGHDLRTGRPVDHECYVLPPAALEAERRGDTDRASEILASSDFRNKRPVKGKRAPLVAGEGIVYDKPIKYHKAHGLYTTKLQDATPERPEIFDVWFDGGDAALPYAVVEKFRNKPLYHVYLYDPGYAANFTYARTIAHVYTKDEALKAVRKAKHDEVYGK
jgi:hypothetical protein